MNVLAILKVRATQNFIKDQMTGRVDIYLRVFEANFIWLLSSIIYQLESLALPDVLVSKIMFLIMFLAQEGANKILCTSLAIKTRFTHNVFVTIS